MLLKRRLSVLWAAAIMLFTVLACSGAALGITNGTPDDEDRYSYVGALVETPKRGAPYPYCSGTLISDTVFLTAAHCGDDREAVKVTFDGDFASNPTTYAGTFHADPINDIAVVEFNQQVSGITPAQLPTVGLFNDAAKGSEFTAVGYGGQLAPKRPGGPVIVYDDQREWAVSKLNSVTRTYLRLSQNKGSGGTCYGDSGGPNFVGEYPYEYENPYPDTNNVPIIASITITGDAWCKTTNVTLRLDIKSSRDFLDDFVTLP